jgi:threonine/homoserine/homoserine lactone efflux protein
MIWPVATDKYMGFLAVMTAMAMMPGPAILFAVAAGMTRGRRGALQATIGMNLAALVWFIGSALGLVVIASTVPWVFKIAGWVGVLYIAYLGMAALHGTFKREATVPIGVPRRFRRTNHQPQGTAFLYRNPPSLCRT